MILSRPIRLNIQGERNNTVMVRALSGLLSEQDAIFFKNLLNQQLDELLDQAKQTVVQLIQGDALAADILDQAAMEMGREYTIRIRDRESRLIRKIKIALDKFEDGSFGICEECGDAISYARLLVRPMAAYCIQCKSQMEVMEKIVGG